MGFCVQLFLAVELIFFLIFMDFKILRFMMISIGHCSSGLRVVVIEFLEIYRGQVLVVFTENI